MHYVKFLNYYIYIAIVRNSVHWSSLKEAIDHSVETYLHSHSDFTHNHVVAASYSYKLIARYSM